MCCTPVRAKEIRARIAQHYPEAEREAVWERVQRQYVDFLSDWRTDLGGKKNFHNGSGGTYDCIAILSYYVACRMSRPFARSRRWRRLWSCLLSAS